ncbi:MAG: IS1 family transposase [Solobacterium sp.]|nr:IS1 family transposase [Solobacterium sp.]
MKTPQKMSVSRRATPWDDLDVDHLTPLQGYLRTVYHRSYDDHHKSLAEMNDAELFNTYTPESCPYCGGQKFIRYGKYSTGLTRYQCKRCGKSFSVTTGTIFEDHKLSIGEWMQYLLNLFDFVSLNSDSKNNRNAFTTSRYWLEKVFMVLDGSQDNILLSGKVWLDETYYSVRKEDIVHNEDGTLLRGLSKNQLCIGVAKDKRRIYCIYEGNGKPSSNDTLNSFQDHIAAKSTIIHDSDGSHDALISKLSLKAETYRSEDLKKLEDINNPLDPINKIHNLLKIFLDSHSGFLRDHISGYLNLFVFIMNPPSNKLKKVELFLDMAVRKKVRLRYRDFFRTSRMPEIFYEEDDSEG